MEANSGDNLYRPKCSEPNRLQDFLNNYISETI